MKVLINYSGSEFILSEEVKEKFQEKTGLNFDKWYNPDNPEEFRHNPDLIEVVESIGLTESSPYKYLCNLTIREIPDNSWYLIFLNDYGEENIIYSNSPITII